MPFDRPTPQELLDILQAELDVALPGADARLRNSVENVLARMIAMAAHMMFGYLDWSARQLFVSSADAEFIDRHANEWGIVRKAATQATGTVAFTGANGNVIPAGTILVRSDTAEFTVDADVTIASGTASANVTAAIPGAAGNTPSAMKLSLGNPIAGVQSDGLVSSEGLTGGFDIEDDNSLRSRVLERKQQPPQGGAKADYERWAKDVAGVTRAWAYPQQLGDGTVVVIFVMDDKPVTIIPSSGEIADVQDYIDNVRQVGAEVTVQPPTLVPVNFQINISPSTQAIKDAITAELTDLFRREAVPGGTLLLSRINEAISTADGEFDHVLIQPAANVEMDFGEFPVVGNYTWGVIS